MAGGQCSHCGREELLPFRCRFCGQPHCSDHRLPENHGCAGLRDPTVRERVAVHPRPSAGAGGSSAGRGGSSGFGGGTWRRSGGASPGGMGRDPLPVKVKGAWPGGDAVRQLKGFAGRSTTHLLLVAIGLVFLLEIVGGMLLGIAIGVGAGAGVVLMQCALALGQCGLPGVMVFDSQPWAVLEKPWTLVTNLFAHSVQVPFHILFNALYLYFFGMELERRIGGRNLLRLFLAAGVVAALGQVILKDGAVIGSSGAVMGILGTLTLLAPHTRVLFFFVPLPLWVMTLLFVFIDLVGLNADSSGVANWAHLLGLALGAAYGLHLKRRGVLPRTASTWAMNRRS